MTRVRFGSSLWKLTTPRWDMPLVVFQTMRSLARRSVIVASHWRRLNQIFSCQRILLRPVFSTWRTRCMNFGYSSKSDQDL
ncbi:MAG TPA: hypothetical protein VKB43_03050 [Gaiellaceae bacterium]|nr:hypothetical protein [Gaiellaceae bacterium]